MPTPESTADGAITGWSDPGLLVLAALAGGPKHGYALTEEIERMAGVRLGPGTLYGAIARLERQGAIAPGEAEGRRRPYALTAEGAATLRRQVGVLERVAAAARAGLAAGGSAG